MLATAQDLTLKVTEMPAALTELKEWSIWMVGLQTGTLALITFIAGENGFLKFTNGLARWAVYFALGFFAASIFFATWVIGGISSIRMRLPTASAPDYGGFLEWAKICVEPPDPSTTGSFYCMPVLENIHVPIVVFASIEHWAFVIGIALFALALGIEKIKDKPAQARSRKDRLQELVELREADLITSEEFDSRKQDIFKGVVAG
jgi:hypothetical protein